MGLPKAIKAFSALDYQHMAERENHRAVNRPLYHMEYIKKYGNIYPEGGTKDGKEASHTKRDN